MSATSSGNPQSNNLYAYVQNDPINFTDPSGLDLVAVTRCQWYGWFITGDGDPRFIEGSEHLVCETDYIEVGGPPIAPITGGAPPIEGGGGGDGDSPYQGIPRLRDEFNKRLNSGNCRGKMNALFEALRSESSIDQLAKKFFNGEEGKKIVSGIPRSNPEAAAEYGNNTIRIKPLPSNTPDTIKVSTDTSNFFHELTHAARGTNGFSHQRIAQAIAEVEGDNFNSIRRQVETQAKARGLKGADKRNFIDSRYSNRMNEWIRNNCNP
jgi:hypothetical protein